jgi:general secretion pathway protein D
VRAAGSWWGLGAALALLASGSAAAAATRVYGLEHQAEKGVERILVFADGPVKARFEPTARRRGVLVIEDAVLDPSAPRRVELPTGGALFAVTASELGGDVPRVRIEVQHAQDLKIAVVERGAQVALEIRRAGPPQSKPEEGILLDVKDYPLRDLVTRIARHTGTPVLFDETLQGNVTVMAKQPFSSAEALMLMDTLLLMKGYVAVPGPGGVRTITRLEGAPWPYVARLPEVPGDEPITAMIHLKSIRADTVLLALRDLLGSTTIGFAHAPTNALILGGSAALITRIVDVAQALDDSGAERIFIQRLRFADAEQTADQLQDAFSEDGLVAVYPDTRTNSVSVRARADSVGELRDFLSRIDRPALTKGAFHVFPVEHADPDELARILLELQQGGGASARLGAARRTPRRAAVVDPVAGGALAGRQFAVVVDPPTHSLLVQADPDTALQLADVIAELDRIPRQVDVEVTLMEVTTATNIELAFDYLIPLLEPNDPDDLIAVVAGVPSGSLSPLFDGTAVESTVAPLIGLPPVDQSLLARFAREPLFLPLVVNGVTVPVAIPRETGALTADAHDVKTDLVLSPRLKLVSGEEHEIFVGETVPIVTEQGESVDPLQVRQNIERQDVGVVLRVKPTLGEAGGVVLELTLEVSALAPSEAGNQAQVGPTITERTLSSKVRLEPDRIAVIGWHGGPVKDSSVVGVPWLKDIPLLGWLFRATREVTRNSNVLITVAAWRDDPEVHALAEAMRAALRDELGTLPQPPSAQAPAPATPATPSAP